MDGLLLLSVILILLARLGSAASAFGTDSRDGFGDGRVLPRFN